MSLDKLNYLQRWCLTSNRWSYIVRKQKTPAFPCLLYLSVAMGTSCVIY